jgi:PEP-CTERM motif
MKKTRNHTDRSRTGISRALSTTAAVLLLSSAAFQANATVTLTSSGATAPGAGDSGISQTNSAGAALPYWLASADNGRAQGQSFTLGGTPADVFDLNSFSLLSGASADGVNHDKGSYADAFLTGTWNVQIERFEAVVSNTGYAERTDGSHTADYLANTTGVSTTVAAGSTHQTFTGIANIGAGYTLGDWVTFSFTGDDTIHLLGGYTYAFSFSSTNGYGSSADFTVADSDVYAGGGDFNGYGNGTFNDNYVHDIDSRDRTFVANITAVPEPTSAILLGGMGLIGLARRRRS